MNLRDDIKKVTPFNVDNEYWQGMENEILNEIESIKSEERLKKQVGNSTPFACKRDYFEGYEQRKESEFPWLSLLAAACVIPFFLLLFNLGTLEDAHNNEAANTEQVVTNKKDAQLAAIEEILTQELSIAELENYLVYEEFSIPSDEEELKDESVQLELPSDISDSDIMDYVEEEIDVELLIDEL
jgi:hypothetical protein